MADHIRGELVTLKKIERTIKRYFRRCCGTQAPIFFQPSQRVSIRRTPQNPNLGLFFNRAEFDDVVQRVYKSYGQHGQAFRPSPELVDYVWEITNGHPAGVHAVLDYLAEVSIDYDFHLYFQVTYQIVGFRNPAFGPKCLMRSFHRLVSPYDPCASSMISSAFLLNQLSWRLFMMLLSN
jgi:hypothetical protein